MNRHSNNTNALLVEIMAAVLFFALCSAVLLQVFTSAHRQSVQSGIRIAALAQARDVLEQLNAADDPQAMLTAASFVQDDEAWHLDCGSYTLTVTLHETTGRGGTLHTSQLTAAADDAQTQLFTLQGAHYCQEVSR